MSTVRRNLVFSVVAFFCCVGVFGLVPVHGDDPPQKGKKMFGFVIKVTSVEGKRDELVARLSKGKDGIPGCLSYIVAKDLADSNVVWVNEVWEDRASFKAAVLLPAVKEEIAKCDLLIAKTEKLARTEVVDSHGLMPAKGR